MQARFCAFLVLQTARNVVHCNQEITEDGMKRGQTKMELNGQAIELIDIGTGWTVWINDKVCTDGVRALQFKTKKSAHMHALWRARAA